MTIEERRKILAARLRGARLKANAQRKLSQRQSPATRRNRYQPLTQAFAAQQLGISQSFLSKLEKGLQEPNFLLVELLSRYYGVRLSVFETYSRDEKRLGHHLNAH
jgi:transcriptional regulator with XRE-family HTH domain